MLRQSPSTGNPTHDELNKTYGLAMKTLMQGDYKQTEDHIKKAKQLLNEAQLTTFDAKTPRGLNPSAWQAVEAALLLRLGADNFRSALQIAEEVMKARDAVLGKDIKILDNTSIRFLLIQIKFEMQDFAGAHDLLESIDEYFVAQTNKQAEPYLTMFFSYQVYQGICQLGLKNLTKAQEYLEAAKAFYEANKQMPNNGLDSALPLFVNYYAWVQSQSDKKNLGKLVENFAYAEEVLKNNFDNKPHIIKVEHCLFKAKALREGGLLASSEDMLDEAAAMLHTIFHDTPHLSQHPYLTRINVEKELLKKEKRLAVSAKDLANYSLTPPVARRTTPHAEEPANLNYHRPQK